MRLRRTDAVHVGDRRVGRDFRFIQYLPERGHDICARYFSGDSEKSLELHNAYSKLTEALFREVNPVPVKAALNVLKKDAGGLRLPLTEADKETKNILKKEIALLQCAGLCQ